MSRKIVLFYKHGINHDFEDVSEFQPGRWHNGRAFVFHSGDCPFESVPSLTSADACGEVTGCNAVALEVDLGECTFHSSPQV